jgi:hypothetical protein
LFMLAQHLTRQPADATKFHVAYLTTEPLGAVGHTGDLHQRQDTNIHVLEWDTQRNSIVSSNAHVKMAPVANLNTFLESRRALWLTLTTANRDNDQETIVASESLSAYLDNRKSSAWAKRLWIAVAILVVVMVGYLGYRWYQLPPATLPVPIIYRSTRNATGL